MVEVFCIPARASPASTSPLSRAWAVNRSEELGEGGNFEEVLKAKEKEQAEVEAVSVPLVAQALLQQGAPPGEMPTEPAVSGGDPGIAVGQKVGFPATAAMLVVEDLPAGDAPIGDGGGSKGEASIEEGVSSFLPNQPEDAVSPEGAVEGKAEPAEMEKPVAQVADQFSRALEMLEAGDGKPSAPSVGVGAGTGEVEKGPAEGSGPATKAPAQPMNPSRAVKLAEPPKKEAPAMDGATVAQVPGEPVTGGHLIQPEAKAVQPSVVENVHQVARAVEASIQSGKNFIRLQLHPHELGGLDVRLVSTTQGVSVTVFADQASTGRLLEMQIDQLRQTLAEAGVQLAHLDVQAQAQPGQQQGFTQTPRRFFYARGEAVSDAEISGMPPALSPAVGLGHRVDYQV